MFFEENLYRFDLAENRESSQGMQPIMPLFGIQEPTSVNLGGPIQTGTRCKG